MLKTRISSCCAKPGRPPICDWPAEDVQAIREVYLRTNRGRDCGSMAHAMQRVLWESERAAEDGVPLITSETVAVLQDLKARAVSPHYVPKSLRKQLAIAKQVFRHHRSPSNAALAGPYIPGMLRLSEDGSRRLFAGERYVADDGSQNQIVVVPWPWGDSKEAERFHHRTMRGQWLVITDCATDKIVAWVFTLRPRDSYRGADTIALVFRTARDVARPDQMVLEGGAWQTRRMLDFLRAAQIQMIDAKGRPHLKLVEGIFNKVWTFMSVDPRGQIGRFRGEYERENDVLTRCRNGTEDGRKHFPLLPDLLKGLSNAVDFHNQKRIESKTYGTWVPNERWDLDLAEHPRAMLSASFAPMAAPEERLLTVRRGAQVETRVMSPLGISSHYVFGHEDLLPFEGAKVRIAFDPFDAEPRAAVTLAGRSLLANPGTLICNAPCFTPPPLPVEELDWQIVSAGGHAGIQMKKAISKAVRTEYRALGQGGRKAALSETRGPEGMNRVEIASPDATRTEDGRRNTEDVRGYRGAQPEPALPRIRSRMELIEAE